MAIIPQKYDAHCSFCHRKALGLSLSQISSQGWTIILIHDGKPQKHRPLDLSPEALASRATPTACPMCSSSGQYGKVLTHVSN